MEYNNSMPSEEFDKDKKEDKIEPLVAEINYKFKAASDKRQDDEDRWLQAYHNYRGKYYKNIQFTEREKSRVFVKVTKTKVLAAYGQIINTLQLGYYYIRFVNNYLGDYLNYQKSRIMLKSVLRGVYMTLS